MSADRERYVVPCLVVVLALAMAAPGAWPLASLGSASHDAIDAHLFLWNFWWTREAIADLHTPYWTGMLLHPNGASLAFSSFPLPYDLASLPIQYLIPGTTGLVVALNLITLLSFAVNALAAYALTARLTASRFCGLIAGLAFACMPYRLLNVARLHVLSTEFLVLFVLAWILFVESPSRPRAVLAGTALAATFYSSLEYALYGSAFVVLWLVWHGRGWHELSRRSLGMAAVATIVFAMLAAPLLAAQARALSRGDVVLTRSLDDAVLWTPALASFVTPSRAHPVYGSAFAFAGEYGEPDVRGMRSETTLSFTVLALVAIGLWRSWRDRTLFWAVGAAFFFVLTLGPYLRLTGRVMTSIPMPYLALYDLVPPLRGSRDPTRALPIAMLMLTVVAAFGFRSCLAHMRTALSRGLLTGIVVVLVLFESLTSWPVKTPAAALVAQGYQRLRDAGTGSAVIDLSLDHYAMLAQTTHGLPITGGRYANPRAAAAEKMLYVETDLRNPAQILALDPAQQSRYLNADREMLDRYQIRFLVLPGAAPSSEAFAGLLGFRLVERGQVTIYTRDASSAAGRTN